MITGRHIIIKLSKVKDKGNFESSKRNVTLHIKENTHNHQHISQRNTHNHQHISVLSKIEWDDIFQILKK